MSGTPAARFTAGCAISVDRLLTLVSEPLDQTTAQLLHRVVGVVCVISVFLTRDQNVQRVVDIVIPLGGVSTRTASFFWTCRSLKVS